MIGKWKLGAIACAFAAVGVGACSGDDNATGGGGVDGSLGGGGDHDGDDLAALGAGAVRDLALVYAIEGKDEYAAKAREIMLKYADIYHELRGTKQGGGAHDASLPESFVPVTTTRR